MSSGVSLGQMHLIQTVHGLLVGDVEIVQVILRHAHDQADHRQRDALCISMIHFGRGYDSRGSAPDPCRP
jgi:hypothetical protein